MEKCIFQQPKIKKLHSSSGYVAWLVDGKYVRDCLNEEFTNFGWNNHFSFIPKKEFWIDYESKPGEAQYFFTNFLMMQEFMKKGLSHKEACIKSDEAERKERAKTDFYKKHQDLPREQSAVSVHKRMLSFWGSKLKIWLVDGEDVRSLFFLDFTEGGHDKVYDFIPENEVWIDDDLLKKERNLVLVHELHERRLMAGGVIYQKAHFKSSNLERFCRKTKIFTASVLFMEKMLNFLFVR